MLCTIDTNQHRDVFRDLTIESKDKWMERVSLILTTYNSKENLRKTLESIKNQDYPNLEVVIKDGGSTDGTLDVIREYEGRISHKLTWESKKDSGIYDAMNQGYELATGDILAFFNDKFLMDNAVNLMVEQLHREEKEKKKQLCGIHADLVYAEEDKIVRSWKMGRGNIRQGWMPGHPTLYLRRKIYEEYGLYRTDLRISADYELMIRFLKERENELAYLPRTIISMYYGGTSNEGLGSYLQSLKEGHQALKINGIRNAWLIDGRRTLKVLKQFVKKGE